MLDFTARKIDDRVKANLVVRLKVEDDHLDYVIPEFKLDKPELRNLFFFLKYTPLDPGPTVRWPGLLISAIADACGMLWSSCEDALFALNEQGAVHSTDKKGVRWKMTNHDPDYPDTDSD